MCWFLRQGNRSQCKGLKIILWKRMNFWVVRNILFCSKRNDKLTESKTVPQGILWLWGGNTTCLIPYSQMSSSPVNNVFVVWICIRDGSCPQGLICKKEMRKGNTICVFCVTLVPNFWCLLMPRWPRQGTTTEPKLSDVEIVPRK